MENRIESQFGGLGEMMRKLMEMQSKTPLAISIANHNQDLTEIPFVESKGKEIEQEEFNKESFYHQDPPPRALIRGKSAVDMELNKAPSASRKLVSNAYARQILKSTPWTKSIRISCDPLRPDSSWNWLERWMGLTSMDRQFILNQNNIEKDMKNELAAYDVNVGLHVISQQASSDSELVGNSPEVPRSKGI
ncbi:hypothetical protein M5K25_015120 [Dendrobium thyrsiflorum]|uniref:Uncharacterized protein n=1 Tax=Dendrobium thyrsiflorum TaxID=117978 RepID=A0ABD0UQ26_DENTH